MLVIGDFLVSLFFLEDGEESSKEAILLKTVGHGFMSGVSKLEYNGRWFIDSGSNSLYNPTLVIVVLAQWLLKSNFTGFCVYFEITWNLVCEEEEENGVR